MQIHWTHLLELTPEIRAAAEERLQRLAQGQSDLIDVRIDAEASAHHRHGGRKVRIACQARGRELVSVRERDELDLALSAAIDDLERRVHELRRRRRDARVQLPPEPPLLGLVDRVFREEGYGFAIADDGTQVYFHRNAVHGGLQFEALEEGQRIGLSVEAGEKGPQASVVLPAPPGAPSP